MIKKQDILTLWITFFTGLLAGSYLYLVGFAPQMERITTTLGTDEQSISNELTIIGTEYGGCSRLQACGSFQVRRDGSYSYLAGSVAEGVQPQTGEIPRALLRELQKAVTKPVLLDAVVAINPVTCDSYVDKNDYRYEITFEARMYNLDTCRTDFSRGDDLGQVLDKLWMYFTTESAV